MQQWYKCPKCGKDILYGTNPCPYCKCSLAQSQQGPILYIPPIEAPQQPPPQYQQPQQPGQTPQYQQQASYGQQIESQRKKKSPWLIGCLGLIGLAVIVGVFAVSSGTPTTTQPPATTPTQPAPSITEPTPEPTPTPSPEFTEAKVVRVIDGDTIEVNIAGKTYTVRYIGIDTPETVHPSKPVEYMGQEASDKNKELVDGKTVKLEKDVSETDKYDRLLRYVYLGDLFINAELVRLGYAQVSTYPPDVKYQSLFLKLQQEARDAGRGLWAAQPQEPTQSTGKYVGSIKSDKYHYPSCSAAKKILPENLIWFDSAADAQSKGYVPCGICKPPLND